ncbi:MAG: type II toxin-antitoxin system HicB family antitoxin [Bosea sp. (in: a-proteobacteria)]
MPASYFALLHLPEPGSQSWGVTFPDLPGCVSSGSTDVEARSKAKEALAGHIAALRADGEEVPRSRTLTELLGDPDIIAEIKHISVDDRLRGGAVLENIELDEIAPPKERINVMLDRRVLRAIDEAARAKGVSRSAFIEQAAGKAALKRTA